MLLRCAFFLIFYCFSMSILAAEEFMGITNNGFPVPCIECIDVKTTGLEGKIEIYLPNQNTIRCNLPTNERFTLEHQIFPLASYAYYSSGFPVSMPVYGFPAGYKRPMQLENGKIGVRVTAPNQEILIAESYLFVPLLYIGEIHDTPKAREARTYMSLHISSNISTNGSRYLSINVMNNNEASDHSAMLVTRAFLKSTGCRYSQPRL